MLRYVFETTEQLQSHLHTNAAVAFFFFPNGRAAGKAGDAVVLEVELRKPRQQLMLHATIHSRITGRWPGLWLQLADLRLVRKLASDAASIGKRRHPRVAADLVVKLREADGSARIARLLDVSTGGARLGATGLRVGTALDIHLFSAPPEAPRMISSAEVVRSALNEASVRFPPQATAGVEKLVEVLRVGWKSAPSVTHPSACCGPAGVLEPPLPRIRLAKQGL